MTTETAPLPFSAQINKFIDSYLSIQDLDKAAVEARLQPEMGRQLWKRKSVREEIERRMAAIEGEVHKQIAKKRIVTVDALDKNLMQVVRLTKTDIKESPTLAASKVKAIELGYQRTGVLIDGNFIPDAGSEANKPDEASRIFLAQEQSIITHHVTETHQVVTNRTVAASVPPQPPPRTAPTIDADQSDPWAKF